jgi:nitric oxide synthase oxygenase domain/subunit
VDFSVGRNDSLGADERTAIENPVVRIAFQHPECHVQGAALANALNCLGRWSWDSLRVWHRFIETRETVSAEHAFREHNQISLGRVGMIQPADHAFEIRIPICKIDVGLNSANAAD